MDNFTRYTDTPGIKDRWVYIIIAIMEMTTLLMMHCIFIIFFCNSSSACQCRFSRVYRWRRIWKILGSAWSLWQVSKLERSRGIPYYMKFSRHVNFANFTISKKSRNLSDAKIKCRENNIMWKLSDSHYVNN